MEIKYHKSIYGHEEHIQFMKDYHKKALDHQLKTIDKTGTILARITCNLDLLKVFMFHGQDYSLICESGDVVYLSDNSIFSKTSYEIIRGHHISEIIPANSFHMKSENQSDNYFLAVLNADDSDMIPFLPWINVPFYANAQCAGTKIYLDGNTRDCPAKDVCAKVRKNLDPTLGAIDLDVCAPYKGGINYKFFESSLFPRMNPRTLKAQEVIDQGFLMTQKKPDPYASKYYTQSGPHITSGVTWINPEDIIS